MRTNIFISILIYVGEYILNGLEYNTVSAAGVIPHKCRPVILTVNGIFFVKLLPMPRSKRSQEVNLTDQRLRFPRSEEHTSELQSRGHLVCRLLLETKNQR